MTAYTEDEAKTKWCPFARALYVGPTGHQQFPSNRLSKGENGAVIPPDSLCIASACMAWEPETKYSARTEWAGEDVPTGRGDCGLKRKP